MPAVMIRCPTSGKPIDTGIALSKEAFDDPQTVMENNVTSCPHCQQMHTWSRKDVFLEGEQQKK
jgi:hypothetical protein